MTEIIFKGTVSAGQDDYSNPFIKIIERSSSAKFVTDEKSLNLLQLMEELNGAEIALKIKVVKEVNGDASQQEQTERQSVHEHNAKTDT
jgi:hypothetical protein